MKICTKGGAKPLSHFYARAASKKDGLANRCKTCSRERSKRFKQNHPEARRRDDKRYREKHRELISARGKAYRERYPERETAKSKARYARRMGKLVRMPCELCGSTENVDAHHDDYGEPLEVRWLCRSCHRHHHEEQS